MIEPDQASVLNDTVQALEALPCDVAAASATASYALRIIDIRGGLLIAQVLSGRQPPLRSSLILEARSGCRLFARIECAVTSSSRRRLALLPVSVRGAGERRSQGRVPSNELFLLYGDQETDTRVGNASRAGMAFMSPFAVEIDSEVKGMLNAADRAFGLSAIVRHCSKRDDSYEVGVEFRFLRNEEADLLAANARANGDGRRHGEGVAPVVTSMEDIRSKFRRFAA